MNVRTVPNVLVVLAIAALTACSASKAPTSASLPMSPAADQPAAASNASASSESADTPTPIPAATDDIWKAIDKQSADLQTAIQGGALKEVHHKAYAIRDLVAALPQRASKLPADAQAKLQQDVKFVATLTERLDATGDAGDKPGAEANYKKLVTVLGGMTRFP